ncbi:MAG: hypothetical protein R2867_22040 [Caldilineaceae bacterium]
MANTDFEKGRLLAYYEVLSLIQQQAVVFDIDLAEIGLKDFNVDKDIL